MSWSNIMSQHLSLPCLDGTVTLVSYVRVIVLQDNESCSVYVTKALDKQKITTANPSDFADCFTEPPGEELTFNFDHVAINSQSDIDEVDLGGAGK